MIETVRIVYVTDWIIGNHTLSDQDPFAEVLHSFDAVVTIQSHLPEFFDGIDLLILHPMRMNPEIFETISQSKDQNPSIKTVVISSAHGSDLFLQAIDVGVDKYLLKPLLPSAVQKVVERLIRQSLETKQAQKAFKQINLMFGAISKTSLLVRIDEKGVIIEVNDLLCRLLGYQSDFMIGSHWMRFVERRFWIFFRTLVRARIQAGEIYRGIVEIIDSKKQMVTVDSTIYTVLDSRNNIEQVIFIGHDVSEMKRAILDSMKQLIDYDTSLAVIFDHRYEAIMVNRKFLELKGYESFETLLASRDLCSWMLETNEGLQPIVFEKCSLKDGLEVIVKEMKKGHIKGRIISIDPNKTKRYYTVHMSSMMNPLIKNEHYHILYFIDVSDTERQKEEKISDAKLMSVGRLAAAITHEINTPLTYIKGNLELLKWECEEKMEDALEFFKPINEGIERIESIVGSMFEFAGTGKEEMKPCNVHMTLVYALRIVLNRSKHIVPITLNGELFGHKTKYNTDSCLTMGISTRLEQVWIIILNNALDEFEKGALPYYERQLEVLLTCGSDEITIRIADNAGGIPEDKIEGIFDFAVGGEKKKSMGIGLNIAKTIIDKHGGSIHVSNDDQGAVFEIVLKVYKENN
ncbi:ATP-binding protein [Sulfuricurvum sp.]|uniref:ATP-binding protein n=1 Tax=Sulfuricurvum sp. TaxID=2025608 RepID=UPI002D6FC8BB|nr:ATP-binding protein [Sulfuricurvum sp.]HZF69704.1 ATP-binding protein [Sulfuricurvum sp.]